MKGHLENRKSLVSVAIEGEVQNLQLSSLQVGPSGTGLATSVLLGQFTLCLHHGYSRLDPTSHQGCMARGGVCLEQGYRQP